MCLQNLVVDIWLVYMVYLAKEFLICNSKTADVNQFAESQNMCSMKIRGPTAYGWILYLRRLNLII